MMSLYVDNTFWKRRFWDGRMGYPLVGACLNGSNFVILSYNFTGIDKIIPLEVYAPLFVFAACALLVTVGIFYRNIQQSTEYDKIFERQPQQAKTFRVILEMALKGKDLTPGERKVVEERIHYLKSIESRK